MSSSARRFIPHLAFLLLGLGVPYDARAADTTRGPAAVARHEGHPAVPSFERFFGAPDSDAMAGGTLLLGELNCTSCHKADEGVGSRILRKQAPILDAVGSRVRPEYIRAFLAAPQRVKPGTTMPDVLASMPEPARSEAVAALTHFLASNGGISDTRPDPGAIERGQTVFNQVGCLGCHDPLKADAVGLATSAPLPDLSAKYTLASLTAFLSDPLKVRPSGRMPGFLLSGTEAGDLASYLLKDLHANAPPTVTFQYYEGTWEKFPNLQSMKPLASGTASGFDLGVKRRSNDYALRFESFMKIDRDGDYTFYLRSDDGSTLSIDDTLVVDNDGIHPPSENQGKAHFAVGMHRLQASFFNAGGGDELEIQFEGPGRSRQAVEPFLYLTAAIPREDGNEAEKRFRLDDTLVVRGRELFARVGCASCHQLRDGKEAIASTLAAAPFAKLKAEGGCLATAHAQGGDMYHLTDRQRAVLIAAIRALAKTPYTPSSPREVVSRTLAAFNCYACHQRDGIGGVEDARNAFFQTTQKEMGDEGRIPPTLNGVGAKLSPDYLKGILENGAKDRPYMLTRMPRFGGGNLDALAAVLPKVDPIEKVDAPHFASSPRRVKSSARFLLGGEALGCIKCHTFKGIQAEGVQAIDMTIMTRRLNHDWFHRYLVDPPAFRPGTRMPTSWPMGKSLLPKVLDGSTQAQIEAIWLFLSDGSNAAEPYGLGRDPIPLVAEKEPILYRNFIQGAGPRAIGVGFPEKANLAFDAEGMRLALIWQGKFIDAARHWNGRGEGYQPPLGDNVLSLPQGAPFARLARDDETWPTTPSREIGYAFRGYRLARDGRPTFLYDYASSHVEDYPEPIAGGDVPGLRRTITLHADNAPGGLWFRAAVADRIESSPEGWYTIDGEWKVRLTAGGTPRVRKSEGKQELLVPVVFTGHDAKIVEEFSW